MGCCFNKLGIVRRDSIHCLKGIISFLTMAIKVFSVNILLFIFQVPGPLVSLSIVKLQEIGA